MMMGCLSKSSTLPGAGETGGGGCGGQLLLDQNKVIQVNLSRSFWKGVGDIKEVLLPNSTMSGNTTFYTNDGDSNFLMEDDNFFEDMTSLYRKQKVLFQRSCEQLKDVFKVEITPFLGPLGGSPFGEVGSENGEELYTEVLYCLINMIGSDAKSTNQFQLVEHLRKAFNIEPQCHLQIYSQVTSMSRPVVRLSLCLVEARDLVSKDVSGTSNPYCTFYITSTKSSPQSTSCKPQTLNPVWNETFTMDIKNENVDAVHIDVWNFEAMPVEGVVDRLRRLSEVKDGRGLKQLIVDTVAPPASDRLIGHVEIPLRELPACGSNTWWTLYKMDGKQKKERGEIHLIQHLFVREGRLKEHIRLLRVMLSHELVRRASEAYTWRDNFSKETLAILAQHAIQARMTRVDTALTRLLVYCQAHLILPLDCRVFLPILEKLRKPVMANQIPDEHVAEFHQTSEKLVESFTTFIRKHRMYLGLNTTKYRVQLEAILQALHILHTMKWRTRNDIVLAVEDALLASVREWFNFVVERIPTQENTCNGKMKNLTRITHLLLADLQEGKKELQSLFWESLNVDYVEISYREFDLNLTIITKALIEKACDTMQPIQFHEEERTAGIQSSLTVGTQLYELYLALQEFYTLGFSIIKKDKINTGDDFTVFHSWFIRAVAKWLDIALYKAMGRIVRAVRLDNLQPVDELSQHSSSAVDVRTVLSQIRTFWSQLGWPDSETSYVFISRIMDDVCRAVIFYAEKMCAKADQQKKILSLGSQHLQCSAEQCLAINNIDYVMTYINPFVSELGIDQILNRIEEQKGGLVADACRKTIRTLMKNSIENVENQILSVLEEVGAKMAPNIERFLFEGQVHCSSQTDRRALLQYLDENLVFLKHRLVAANFERVLSVMWAVSSNSLSDILHKSIEKRKSPKFFVSLHETFKILLNFFYGDKIPQDGGLQSTKRLLELFSSEPPILVQSYYRQRFEEQSRLPAGSFPLGSITVKLQILGSHIRILVLNCRHLKPVSLLRRSRSGDQLTTRDKDTTTFFRGKRINRSSHNLSRTIDNKMDCMKDTLDTLRLNVSDVRARAHRTANQGMCSPYVTVKLVPGTGGAVALAKVRTATKSRTLFPLFDETFDVVVPESCGRDRTFLLFAVKDRGPLGDKILLGEAVLPLENIPIRGESDRLEEGGQVQLALTLPGPSQLDILTALQTRRSSLSKETKTWLNNQRKKIFLQKFISNL